MLAPLSPPRKSPLSFLRGQSLVGSDLLASLSIGLYDKPLTLYRELLQNAADAYEHREREQQHKTERRVDIALDPAKRTISVRDYALGLDEQDLQRSMLTLGQSRKHNLRGFRGIGRLAGLGLCKTLSFRSRQHASQPIAEVVLDGQTFLDLADQRNTAKDIAEILEAITTLSYCEDDSLPERFFECRLQGVRRTPNDSLLNQTLVSTYIAEYCPVPFADDFSFASDIRASLGEEHLFALNVYINQETAPLCRLHADSITAKEKLITTFSELEEIDEFNTLFPLAKGWLLHHDYPGALPTNAHVRGLRLRVGNMQIGEEDLLKDAFSEPRFSNWCVGEIHILGHRLRPNTLRSNFEPSPLWDDFLNCAGGLCRRLQDVCRKHSEQRSKRPPKSMTLPASALPSHALSAIERAARQRLKAPQLPEQITIKLNQPKEGS